MNQILYKGYTFGGVGEDVTNKQHTITLNEQELETVGGENSEVFNNYKGQNINIAEGENSTVIGSNNKELRYVLDGDQYVRPGFFSTKPEYNFINGWSNQILCGGYQSVLGKQNIVQGGDSHLVTGSGNKITGGSWSIISGSSNQINHATGCAIFGETNQTSATDWNIPWDTMIVGKGNQIRGTGRSAIIGHENISDTDDFSLIVGTNNHTTNNHNGEYGAGTYVFGGYNNVAWANGCIVVGYNNTVSSCGRGAVFGENHNLDGSYNTLVTGLHNITNSDYSIIGGEANDIKGNHTLVCGIRNKAEYAPQSLIIGSYSKTENVQASIIAGYQTYEYPIQSNSIEAKGAYQSILQGKKIRIGRFSQKIGITTDITTSPISLMTGYTTEQRSYGGVFNGYLIYNEYNSYTKDEDTIYYIINTKYFYREGGYTWNISDQPPSSSTYLGTTITNISEGSTQHDFSIITSVEYNATISSFKDQDILQICNSTNYSLENKYYYSNSQWNEQTYEFGPFDAYNCLISGVNIEARGGLKSCEIFGDNQIINAAYTSANGMGNNINGQYININGGNNIISGFQMTCYGSQNNVSGSNILNIGNSNSFGGNYLYNIGDNNTLVSGNLYNIGNNNIINGRSNTLSIGQYLKVNEEQEADTELLLGKYNTPANKLLILGNGTADNNRSNALEIDYDGSQIITLKDTSVTGLGIGKITINQQNIIFESLKENSSQQKETVEFTFEDLKQIKQISQLPNLDNNSYPISV